MTPTNDRIPARGLGLVLGLSLALNAAGIWWGLPTVHSWAPDEVLPSRVLTGLEAGFSGGWSDKYPPLQFYLLSVAYSPALGAAALARIEPGGPAMTLILELLGRLVSLAMGLGCVLLVARIGNRLMSGRASLLAALFAALVVPFPYYAKIVNLDVPYLFWFLLSLWFFVRILESRRLKDYVFFGLAAAAAVGTKDQAYALYILAPVPLLWNEIAAWRKTAPSRPDFFGPLAKRWLAAAGAGAAGLAAIHNLAFNAAGFKAHLALITGPAMKGYQMVEATAGGQARLLGLTAIQVFFCLGGPLLALAVLGLVLALRRGTRNARLLLILPFGVSYYLFYIAVIRYSYDRFCLPLCVLLAFFAGAAADRLLAVRRGRAWLRGAVWGTALYSLALAASVDAGMILDSRYAVERWMAAHIPAGATIRGIGYVDYLPRLDAWSWTAMSPDLAAFARDAKPDFVIFPSAFAGRFAPGTPQRAFFSEFRKTAPGYREALRYRTPLDFLPLRTAGVPTNLSLINPEIRIFARRGSPAAAVAAPGGAGR